MHPFYIVRVLGGLMYLGGALIMVYNLWRTARGDIAESAVESVAPSITPAMVAPAAVAKEALS
jgi:cytochrome c oxidase cbb3-type subunit 1